MATIRVGFSSDFNVSDSKIGIGTTNPTSLLEVTGTAKGDLNISGVSTLTAYSGFIAQNQRITKEHNVGYSTASVGTFIQYYEVETGFTELGSVGNSQSFNTLSEDLVVEDGKIFSIHNTEMYGDTTSGKQDEHTHASHVSAGSLEQVSVTGHFSVPDGGIDERPEIAIEGTVRFNTDLNTLEFFNGVEWKQFTYNQRSGRGVFGGGANSTSAYGNMIDYIQIMSTGNAIDFGDMTVTVYGGGACGNETRANFFGGRLSPGSSGYTDRIDLVTIASGGGGIDYGDLVGTTVHTSGCSSSIIGFKVGGYNLDNDIEFWQIATGGQAIDFAHLTAGRHTMQCFTSSTRGFTAGGAVPGDNRTRSVDIWNMASTGNAVDFGDMTSRRGENPAATSNSVRGLIMGGMDPIGRLDSMEYVTMSTSGSFVNFGNLTTATQGATGAATAIRAVIGGGTDPAAARTNTIEYVTIASLGNAKDFGDLTVARSIHGATSDSHGGLGGF